MNKNNDSHNLLIGYLAWIFGFMGAHRFYYGKPKSGTLYFFTLGLLGIGWVVDFFLIPSMEKEADRRFVDGPTDYSIAWLFLIYLGIFGVHRMYMGKWVSGFVYLLSGGIFGIGWLYDLWTLNSQISEVNVANKT